MRSGSKLQEASDRANALQDSGELRAFRRVLGVTGAPVGEEHFAALEERVVTPEKTFVSTGQLVLPNPYDKNKPSIFKDKLKCYSYENGRFKEINHL